MKYLKQLFKGNIRQYGMIVVMVVMAIFFHLVTDGLLLTPLNLTNIILQNAYILIMICGMLPLILTGMFDMSVGSVAAVIGALAAILQVNMKVSFLPALLCYRHVDLPERGLQRDFLGCLRWHRRGVTSHVF